jgi:hypothetical protein
MHRKGAHGHPGVGRDAVGDARRLGDGIPEEDRIRLQDEGKDVVLQSGSTSVRYATSETAVLDADEIGKKFHYGPDGID